MVSLLALTIIFFIVDFGEFWQALKNADYRFLAAGLILYKLAFFVRAKAWHLILDRDVPYSRAYLVMNVGYLLNNILPFRLGELGRAALLGSSIGFFRVLSTIIVERVLDMMFASIVLLIGLAFMVVGPGFDPTIISIIIGTGMVLLLATFYWAANRPETVIGLITKTLKRFPRLVDAINPGIQSAFEGFRALTRPDKFIRVVFWLGLNWGMAVIVHYLWIRAFIPQTQLHWAAFTLGAASMGIALPSSPSYVGVLEGVIIAALSVFAVGSSDALAYAVVSHIIYIALTGVIGAVGIYTEGTNLGSLYRQITTRKLDNHESRNDA